MSLTRAAEYGERYARKLQACCCHFPEVSKYLETSKYKAICECERRKFGQAGSLLSKRACGGGVALKESMTVECSHKLTNVAQASTGIQNCKLV